MTTPTKTRTDARTYFVDIYKWYCYLVRSAVLSKLKQINLL